MQKNINIKGRTSQVALMVKNLLANAGDVRDACSVPGSGRSPEGGHSNPLQHSCLENPVDRGVWQATVHGVTRIGHDFTTKLPLCKRDGQTHLCWVNQMSTRGTGCECSKYDVILPSWICSQGSHGQVQAWEW